MADNSTRDKSPQNTTKEDFQVQAPAISLPKGGGAIRGMGEKFAANPVTGTGSMSVPIATSPGRSGFGPELTLSYDSGAGNGPFGFGWSLSLPSIARKTDKGLPRYWDADESDVFILSGAEDLVPILVKSDEKWVREKIKPRLVGGNTYIIHRYRPRIEGLFARIERWTNQADPADTFWRSISRDNITTWYGKSPNSRIADPTDTTRIFSWLICESHDDKGNVIVYNYVKENSANIYESAPKIHERNRSDTSRSAQRYLKNIRYGNHTPYLPNLTDTARPFPQGADDSDAAANWFFEVVFDYGEHDEHAPMPNDHSQNYWPCRPDPFSSYRSGFEVRTYRLCQRVLMFHHFPKEDIGANCLVRSTDFTYRYEQDTADPRNPIYSFLVSVSQNGYKRQDSGYLKKSLPPLEFEYSPVTLREAVEEVDAESLENLPVGLSSGRYQWVDLDGAGMSGILSEQSEGWFYKRNLSPITVKKEPDRETVVACFAPVELVAQLPSLADVGNGRQQFLDLAGDGQLDLVDLNGPVSGFYERTQDQGWVNFRPFPSLPNIPWDDPNLRFVDLTGDGHADILITQDEVITWYPSLGEEGFAPAERVYQSLDEETGPRLLFADGTQSIQLADLSGDGLSDLVRIRNGEICYWPNLGYGRFGAKVSMDDAPWFDTPDQFDQRRIRLADIDGSGTTDIIYLGRDGVHIYYNQSGNGWSDAVILENFPQIDNLSAVQALDLLGNGTACLVWSSPLPNGTGCPMRYIDLMGGQKPHLLIKTANNLGAETEVQYAPSTKFYLADKLDGKPWITRLPFPVHCVERVITFDHISHNRFVTRHAYHHANFDGEEREFRGFGMVEQWDTEEFAALTADGTLSEATNLDAASHVPPVLIRTWFHTGIYVGRDQVSNFFAGLLDGYDRGEYYREPAWRDDDDEARKYLLEDTILPDGLTIDEAREACRALKGSMLRQEVYALDGTGTIDYPHGHPYTVTEQNFTIKHIQPRKGNHHGVFYTHAREVINYHYERNDNDPRIGHAMTLDVDKYGNLLKSLAIGYGRRPGKSPLLGEDKEKQEQVLITYTENDVTRAIDGSEDDPKYDPDNYRTPLPAETRSYEVTGFKSGGDMARFSFKDFAQDNLQLLLSLPEIKYEEPTDYNKKQKRLIKCVRTLYRKNDLTGLLTKDQLEPKALPGESYRLAFTPDLLTGVFRLQRQDGTWDELVTTQSAAEILGSNAGDGGGYVDLDRDDHWWIPSGRIFYHPDADTADPAATASLELAEASQHFFVQRKYADPFGHSSTVDYEYDLLVTKTKDALDNTVRTANDYSVLQPAVVTGPNGNRSFAAFDALGLMVAAAVRGKQTESLGDFIDDFNEDITQELANPTLQTLQAFVASPQDQAASLLERATTRIIYDLDRYHRCGQPPFAATLARETHVNDLEAGERTKIQISFSYSDGFGREIQKKIQAEAGNAPERQADVQLPSGDIRAGDLVRDAQGELLQTNTPHRWVGSGRTVFNNKGKPVRQYEPFFSSTHLHEPEREMTDIGVSPVLFYDPVERVVATLYPNHTYEKVVFDPWQRETWDVNDTVAIVDPRGDLDVCDFFHRLPEDNYLPTWHVLRTVPAYATEAANKWPDPRQRIKETEAVEKAVAHNDTPSTVHFDALGRQFLTIVDNGKDANGSEQKYRTRIRLNIEGNQRAVIDAKGRVVMRYDYNMTGPDENEEGAGNLIHQASMEAGARWMLNDVTGKPIRAWDSRGFRRRMAYDTLRRPVALYVSKNGQKEFQVGKTVYGEGPYDDPSDTLPNPEQTNHRGKPYRVYDNAGVVTSQLYDFKGNLLRSSRQLVQDYKNLPDWPRSPGPVLDIEVFSNRTWYDALNRPIQMIAPHSDRNGVRLNIFRPGYNEANLLERLDALLQQTDEPQELLDPAGADLHAVTNIDYNAKGQRTRIDYGNGVRTEYSYDPKTFRLAQLLTIRGNKSASECMPVLDPRTCEDPPAICSRLSTNRCVLQNLSYTYDPAGNITHIRDDAQQIIFFRNRRVEPSSDYTYDALYRLIEAQGREHIGSADRPWTTWNDEGRVGLAYPLDGHAICPYTEHYVYDEVGNFLNFIHSADSDQWQLDYAYEELSLLGEPGDTVVSNRLSRTTLHPNGAQPIVAPYAYDAHGNMTQMPHLPLMQWDFKDQLSASSRQVRNDGGTPEITYYVYDAGGQRVRKVTERQATEGETPTRMKERIYLGGFEIYREYDSGSTTCIKERETLHIMDDQKRIALVETKTFDTENADDLGITVIRYQIGNHLDSASLELDRGGAVISYEEYHPYGTTSFQAGRSQAEVSLKRYRYTGMERDEETGLNYHGARYYALWLGRWVSCDLIWSIQHTSLYSFAFNNTVMFRDLNGSEPVCDFNVTSCARMEAIGSAYIEGYGASVIASGIDEPLSSEDPSSVFIDKPWPTSQEENSSDTGYENARDDGGKTPGVESVEKENVVVALQEEESEVAYDENGMAREYEMAYMSGRLTSQGLHPLENEKYGVALQAEFEGGTMCLWPNPLNSYGVWIHIEAGVLITGQEFTPYISVTPGGSEPWKDPLVIGASADVGIGAGLVTDVDTFVEGKGWQSDLDAGVLDIVVGVDEPGEQINYVGAALTRGPGWSFSVAPTETFSLRLPWAAASN